MNYVTTGRHAGKFSVDSSKNHYEINWLSNDCDLFGCQEKNTNNPRPETLKNLNHHLGLNPHLQHQLILYLT